jgi:hypothetical protein
VSDTAARCWVAAWCAWELNGNVLTNLLSSPRFVRLVEQEAIDGISVYTPSEFLADVRKGVWKELDAPQVKIDAYCRNL